MLSTLVDILMITDMKMDNSTVPICRDQKQLKIFLYFLRNWTKNPEIFLSVFSKTILIPLKRVTEYKNLQWTVLGQLASPRTQFRIRKIKNEIYLFGGTGRT